MCDTSTQPCTQDQRQCKTAEGLDFELGKTYYYIHNGEIKTCTPLACKMTTCDWGLTFDDSYSYRRIYVMIDSVITRVGQVETRAFSDGVLYATKNALIQNIIKGLQNQIDNWTKKMVSI